MKKFNVTINGEPQTVLASSTDLAVKRAMVKVWRQVTGNLKSGDAPIQISVTRIPYTKPKPEPKPEPVKPGIRVGDVRWSLKGLVRVIGMQGDMWQVRVIGDENRVGDILVDDLGRAVATITSIASDQTSRHQQWTATTVEGQPLEVGDNIDNFSRRLRVEAAAREGAKRFANSPGQRELRAELAGLGL